MNFVLETGRLTADPELRTTRNGKSVCNFAIAVRRPRSDETDFFNCVAWNSTAEFLAKHFKKGSGIEIKGRLNQRKWTDNDGKTNTAYEIIVEDIDFGKGKAADNASQGNAPTNDASTDDELPF